MYSNLCSHSEILHLHVTHCSALRKQYSKLCSHVKLLHSHVSVWYFKSVFTLLIPFSDCKTTWKHVWFQEFWGVICSWDIKTCIITDWKNLVGSIEFSIQVDATQMSVICKLELSCSCCWTSFWLYLLCMMAFKISRTNRKRKLIENYMYCM